MHEHSLMADLMKKIETVRRNENARRVVSLKVRIGPLAHISEDHFREHFLHSSAGTPAEGAELVVEMFDDIHHPNAQDICLVSLDVE